MISKISFGNIIKVKAPENRAREIYSELNNVISDKKLKGSVCSYSFYDSKEETYIFTGKEAVDFWDSYSIAWDDMNEAYAYYGGNDLAGLVASDAWETHRKNVQNIINSYPHKIPEIECQCGDKNELKSINIIV